MPPPGHHRWFYDSASDTLVNDSARAGAGPSLGV